MTIHRLTDHIAVSDAPSEEELRTASRLGFRTIIDLRADGEPHPRGIAPWKEARLATEIGLAYRQIPVEPPRLTDRLGDLIRQAVRDATPPVLLHCTTGRRSGVCGLLVVACDERLTVAWCLERGVSIGLDFESMPRLTAFLKRYVERCAGRPDIPTDSGFAF
jgi:uncharacterized protein (TIGR01244 family)